MEKQDSIPTSSRCRNDVFALWIGDRVFSGTGLFTEWAILLKMTPILPSAPSHHNSIVTTAKAPLPLSARDIPPNPNHTQHNSTSRCYPHHCHLGIRPQASILAVVPKPSDKPS